jgi:predicted dinucleotide-binding enzyme
MKVGILGSGDVGRALGKGLAGLGHEVVLGTRDPSGEKARGWVAAVGSSAKAATNAEAAQLAELIVLATLWSGTEEAIRLAGQANFAGKVVIDATNPLVFAPGKPPGLAVGHTDSGGEQVQRWLPGARVVKAFNIVGNAHMVHPDFPCGPPDMFIAGNDDDAKKTVTGILDAWGWRTTDFGGIEGARYLEPMCIAWVLYGMKNGAWNHAFKMLTK